MPLRTYTSCESGPFALPWPTSTGCSTRLGNAHGTMAGPVLQMPVTLTTLRCPAQVPRYQASIPTTGRPAGSTRQRCCAAGPARNLTLHTPPKARKASNPMARRAEARDNGRTRGTPTGGKPSRHDMYHVATSRCAETASSHAPCASNMEEHIERGRATVPHGLVTINVSRGRGLRRVVACGHPQVGHRACFDVHRQHDKSKAKGRVHRE
jgi:hypothetical protein